MGKTINWTVSREDSEAITQIVRRADALGLCSDRLSLDMDITATHANGCPLDLGKLLAFPAVEFVHDIVGIRAHLNRKTGELEDCFLPRSTK